jgi:lipopolysaccharide transport system ATP-binding protein
LGGIGRPDEGSAAVMGRVGALLSLGAGFHPDLTGRENAFVNGAISGLTRKEIAARFEAIVEFAGLSTFIDSPLRTYSSGMQMRLAFSVAIHTEPEVLLIDEVLAVGDHSFQQKCIAKIEELRDHGCATILVSHDAELVRTFCDQVLWLDRGRVLGYGPTERVVNQYLGAEESDLAGEPSKRLRPLRTGTGEVEIRAVEVLNGAGTPVQEVRPDEELTIRISWRAPQRVASPIFGVAVTRADGLVLLELNTEGEPSLPGPIEGEGSLSLQLTQLNLIDGSYLIDAGVYAQNWECIYDDRIGIARLRINAGAPAAAGLLNVPHRWRPSA